MALKLEDDILRKRLSRIKEKGFSVLVDLKQQAEKIYNKMDDWIGDKFRNEVSNIEKLVELIKEVVENESKLPQFQIESSKLIVIENSLNSNNTNSTSDESGYLSSDNENSSNNNNNSNNSSNFQQLQGGEEDILRRRKLSPTQLLDLSQRLSHTNSNYSTTNRTISVRDFLDWICNLSVSSKEFGTEEVPLEWMYYDRATFQEMIIQLMESVHPNQVH